MASTVAGHAAATATMARRRHRDAGRGAGRAGCGSARGGRRWRRRPFWATGAAAAACGRRGRQGARRRRFRRRRGVPAADLRRGGKGRGGGAPGLVGFERGAAGWPRSASAASAASPPRGEREGEGGGVWTFCKKILVVFAFFESAPRLAFRWTAGSISGFMRGLFAI